MSDLEKLARHRDAILLAEAIGWLHDYRKCSEEQLQVQSANPTGQGISRKELTNRFSVLATTPFTISSVTEQIADLLNQWSGKANNARASFLLQYLSRCHNTAHFDKQEPLDTGKQNFPSTQISTAFGFEIPVGTNLTTGLWALPWNDLSGFHLDKRIGLRNAVQALFTRVGADTRRPINEINLWDWGVLVGALYKTVLAAAILGKWCTTRDLKWRLMAIRTNGVAYLCNVNRLPDLIARQNTLQAAFDKVKTLLEETYPLAAEVYRDENGSLYVVPDVADLLKLQNKDGKRLKKLILREFTTDGDLVPQIRLDQTAWWGQDPDRQGNDEIPPASKILSSSVTLQSDVATLDNTWSKKRQTICPVCGLRPCVDKKMDYCRICGDRRKGRFHEWLEDRSKTIWVDEVADQNGRLALIIGTFDLPPWLDGSLIETLLIREPLNGNSPVTKTPSFARLRRIWETTRIFWKTSQDNISQILTDNRRRLMIKLANASRLKINQTYELDLLGNHRMTVLWDGNQLISIANLDYTAKQLNIKKEKRKTPADAALSVGVWFEENQQNEFQLLSDDEKNFQIGVKITDIDYQKSHYAITIPILAEPRTFMALVPANRALDVVEAVKTKYEREMGKVRNRLAMHLGIVYFHRRTPLRAALDAGRRMLEYDLGRIKDEVWNVQSVDPNGVLPDEQNKLANGTQQFNQTIIVNLEQNGRSLTWYVPAKMGDGTADDNWYPYVFIQSHVSGCERVFKALRPRRDGSSEVYKLVHAAKLQPGDEVYFTPATLDFQWLDSAGRRFEIAYDENGRRRDHLTRPYLLDDLMQLRKTWDLVAGSNGLTSNQIYGLRDLVETKRQNWQPTIQQCQRNGMFWQFCHNAVVNANWKQHPSREPLEELTDRVVSGLFSDVIHLFMGVMKQKPKREENDGRSESS